MELLVVYLFSALSISFLCSIAEAVLLSTPLSFLVSGGSKSGSANTRFAKMKQNIDKPLSAILSLNTVAHTVGAAGVGAQSISVFGDTYFGIISAVMTILILVFTEIIPKTIGAKYWNKLTGFTVNTISVMMVATYPLILLSGMISGWFRGGGKIPAASREEIMAIVKTAAEEGILIEKELKIIQNAVIMKSIGITQIMTPRVVVSAANENMKLHDFLKNKNLLYYSRRPVYSGSSDNATGYVLRQSVFEKMAEGKTDALLGELKRDILVFGEKESSLSVFEKMVDNKEHIALITDEFGGMSGIVTLEDIIETLIGFEIVDEKDRISDLQQYAREKWKLKQDKYRLMYMMNNKNPGLS